MKNIISRRIIILITIAIITTSVFISLLGVYLSENVVADVRSKELMSDLSILTQCILAYQDGDIEENVIKSMITNAAKDSSQEFYIFDEKGMLIIQTNEKVSEDIQLKIDESLGHVLVGADVNYELFPATLEPLELIGVPIVTDGLNHGAVFVTTEMYDLARSRAVFIKSLIISIILVIVVVLLISNIALRHIIKPFRKVASVALSMIEGDFSRRVDETLVGEVGLIGRSMNMLSINLYQNVSQLYIEKNRLQHVLNSLEEGMLAVDEHNKITHYNQVFLNMFNLKEEDVKEISLNKLSEINETLGAFEQVIEGNKTMVTNGIYEDLIYRVITESIENDKDEIVGAVILFKDITEVEKLETMRKNYVANVSHELRSPLTSIRGLIEPLMDSIVTDENDIKRYYTIIYKESLRLSRLVDDIMELSRLQTSDTIITKSSVSLNPILDMLYERYRLMNENIELVYNPMVIPEVYTNYDRIEQVLVILVDNAFKFTREGGKIYLQTEIKNNKIIVSVKDTGTGIEQEHLPFVFNRFFKADQSRTQKGTGLGLSIAQEIINAMDEDIFCESEVGLGSKFSFTIHMK